MLTDLVKIENVTKSFGTKVALKGVSFSVPVGQLCTWGGWPALLGSAAFFTIYHPPLSWLPVFLAGLATAVVFKKTGHLAAAVILHMVYNAIVV